MADPNTEKRGRRWGRKVYPCVSLSLTREARDLLDALASDIGGTRTDALEWLLRWHRERKEGT